jgi:hypothetical protein
MLIVVEAQRIRSSVSENAKTIQGLKIYYPLRKQVEKIYECKAKSKGKNAN